MNNKLRKKILFEMIRMREVELKIQREYSNEEMRCPIHLSVGQEAIPVGISNNLSNSLILIYIRPLKTQYLLSEK